MTTFNDLLQNKYEIHAMANLASTTTGIDGVVLWVSVGEFEGKKSEHHARIKVVEGTSMSAANLSSAAVITIEDTPKLIHGSLKPKNKKAVIKFIALNKEALLGYWEGKFDTFTFVHKLVPITK